MTLEKVRYYFFFIVIGITLIIPKAGDKIAGVPVTLASILFGLLVLLFVPVLVKRRYFLVDKLFIVYSSIVLLVPWIIYGGNFGAFARIAMPVFVALVVYYWINPISQIIINSKERLTKLFILIASANIVVDLYGLTQKFFGHYQTIIPGITMSLADANLPNVFYLKSNQIGEIFKVTSTYQNGNVLGTALVMTMIPVLALFINATNKKEKLLFGISSLLSYIIIPLTMSRAAFFGAATGTGLLFLLTGGKKAKAIIAIAGILVFGVILSNPMLRERMLGQFFDPTMNGRVGAMAFLVEKAESTPKSVLFGLGFNKRESLLRNTTENIFSYCSEITYFTVWLWTGLIGLASFIAVIGRVEFRLFKTLRKVLCNRSSSAYTVGIFAGVTAYLIQSFIEGAFHLLPMAFIFWLLVGLGNTLTNEEQLNA